MKTYRNPKKVLFRNLFPVGDNGRLLSLRLEAKRVRKKIINKFNRGELDE